MCASGVGTEAGFRGVLPTFSYQGEIKDLRGERVYVGETKELGDGGGDIGEGSGATGTEAIGGEGIEKFAEDVVDVAPF